MRSMRRGLQQSSRRRRRQRTQLRQATAAEGRERRRSAARALRARREARRATRLLPGSPARRRWPWRRPPTQRCWQRCAPWRRPSPSCSCRPAPAGTRSGCTGGQAGVWRQRLCLSWHAPRLAAPALQLPCSRLGCPLPPPAPPACSSRWGSDPLFRGSYSLIPAGATPADVAALAAPLYADGACRLDEGHRISAAGVDGKGAAGGAQAGQGGAGEGGSGAPQLLFAGEACHVTFIGCLHAAHFTGQAAAELLLERWAGAASSAGAATA